jgi:hypothetical protein
MLALAFHRGDLPEARRLADAVAVEGAAAWRLGTTVQDLRDVVAGLDDGEVARGLGEVLARLEGLLADDLAAAEAAPPTDFVAPRVEVERPGVLGTPPHPGGAAS